jgi:hypothetical protein
LYVSLNADANGGDGDDGLRFVAEAADSLDARIGAEQDVAFTPVPGGAERHRPVSRRCRSRQLSDS